MPGLRSRLAPATEWPEDMALTEDASGADLAGASVHQLSPYIRECTAGAIPTRGGSLGGHIRGRDEALEFFERAAKRRGQPLAKFLREAGILTKHQEQEIARREVPFDEG